MRRLLGLISSVNYGSVLSHFLLLNGYKYSVEQFEWFRNLLIAETNIELIDSYIKKSKREQLLKLWTEID